MAEIHRATLSIGSIGRDDTGRLGAGGTILLSGGMRRVTRRDMLILGSSILLGGCALRRTSHLSRAPTMERITSADGTPIAFTWAGTGPPLLLVHGTTADHRRWAPVSPRLEQHFTVYAMDRRGRGESGDASAYHILREAEDVAAVVDTIGGPVYVLAHSYGAICSLEASLLTDRITRLILYEPPLPTGISPNPPDVADRMQALVDGGELEAALEMMFREVVRMPDHELAAFRQSPMWPVRISLAATIPRELVFDRSYAFDPRKFAGFTVPTLLLLGGDSPPIFRLAVEALDAALPDSRTVILPGQQHIAMDTNPELFLSEVLEFLLE